MCQVEQMKDQQKRQDMLKDFDDAWKEILERDHRQRTDRENLIEKCRWQNNLSTQDFLKQQMSEKIERSLKIFDEINDEQKQFAKISQEDFEAEQERLRKVEKLRKSMKEDISVIFDFF